VFNSFSFLNMFQYRSMCGCNTCASHVSLFYSGTLSCHMCNQFCHEVYKMLYQISLSFFNVLAKEDFPFEFYNYFIHCHMFCWMIGSEYFRFRMSNICVIFFIICTNRVILCSLLMGPEFSRNSNISES
jgi:hypothetical protein